MHQDGGKVMKINFFQEQLGERFESNGLFYFFGEANYIFDTFDQRLIYERGKITTINKVTRQIILDAIIPGEITIFDILTGSQDSIVKGEWIIEKKGYRIPFNLKNWGLKGAIWTLHDSGQPREIYLRTGEESEVRIKIIYVEPAIGKSVGEIDLSEFEIIDLRE